MRGSDIAMALSRFGRVDNDAARETAGTGLGLPLTKALADRYAARLEIHSQRDVGTVVNLRFPADRVLADRAVAPDVAVVSDAKEVAAAWSVDPARAAS